MGHDSIKAQVMAKALAVEKNKNGHRAKLYKEASDEHKGQEISLSIQNKATALKQAINAPKVDLSNTQEVQERTFVYLDACQMAQCFPSVMGLSGAMGCSRQNLNRWLLSHPGHATTDFINMTKDVMADILTNASLCNNSNPVMTIFTLKNHFEHADRVEIFPVVQNQFDTDEIDVEAIRRRYMLEDTDTEE